MTVPLLLARRSTPRSELSDRALVALAVPLVGSLLWLLVDRPDRGGDGADLRAAVVLFGGFYLVPLVLSSWLFLRSAGRREPRERPR